MPDIHLVISDAALRAAVAEAVKLAGYGDAWDATDMAAALDDAGLVILDDADADKKSLKAFQSAQAEGKKYRVFLLGEADTVWIDNPAIESFPKPLRLGHMLTRLAFHIHALPRLRNGVFTFGPYRLESQKRQIIHEDNGTVIRLTEKETALLDYLAQSDAPVGREELLAAVWGYDGSIDTHTLETHIYQLRRKLDAKESGFLVNKNGAYCLTAS